MYSLNYYLGHSPGVFALGLGQIFLVLQHLLAEGQKGLTPQSVSCRAEANLKLEHGLWALGRDRKRLESGQREQCVCGLSLRTGEE